MIEVDSPAYIGNVNPSGRGMNGSVYDSAGISPTLTTNKGEGMKFKMPPANEIQPTFRVRKLTQKECWRLMGFDDQDFENAKTAMNKNIYNGSDRCGSQLYKQAGNSIVVDVLSAIMGELYKAMPYLFEDMVVGSFFSGIGAFEKALSTFDCVGEGVADVPIEDDALKQVGYINGYNGDANRIYDSSTVARVLKAEAGGAELRQAGTKCLNSKVNGKQPSLSRRIYDPSGIAAAVTTSDFFMPRYLTQEVDKNEDCTN